jgi:hypothetical protein
MISGLVGLAPGQTVWPSKRIRKSVVLLERLDIDYGHTIAGRRAKKALHRFATPSPRKPTTRTSSKDRSDQLLSLTASAA